MPLPHMPRPATVLAFAALVIALTGSAIAAKKYVITSTKQIAPKVLKQLNGKTGPAGPKGDTGATGARGDTGAAGAKGDTGAAGPKGDTGTAGTNGTNGTNGSDASGAMMGKVGISANNTIVSVPNGTINGCCPGTGIDGTMTPNRALVFKEFAFRVPALTGAESITATVTIDGVNTAVTCTVTAPATMCTSDATVNVPARSILGIKVASGPLGAVRTTTWSWTFA